MQIVECTSAPTVILAFSDVPGLSFNADGSRIQGFNLLATKVDFGPVNIPSPLVTAFRVTHKGTAFDLDEDHGKIRAVASGVRALAGHLSSCDLRSALAAIYIAKAMGADQDPARARVKHLALDLCSDAALVRACLPRVPGREDKTLSDVVQLQKANAELRHANTELMRANEKLRATLNHLLPPCVTQHPSDDKVPQRA